MSLFERTLNFVKERRDRILSGKINCIPIPFKRFSQEWPGIEQGKSLLFTANSKVGKSQICDFLLLYNTIKQVIDNNLDIRLKIYYFTLEMTSKQKMLSAFSNIIFENEGIRIAPKDLRSTNGALSEEVVELILKYEPYFRKIEEIVHFIDSIRTPYGIYATVRDYALSVGTIFKKQIETKAGEFIEVEDYYQPNDPDEYVIIIVDHLALLEKQKDPETGIPMNLQESITKLSSDYFVKLRNRFNYIPVAIQQQMAGQESVENKKFNKLKPTLDGLGEVKTTQRDFDYILGLFSPFRHEIPEYLGYDVMKFKDSLRFLEILGGREGGGGSVCPLYFDGAVNHFAELPLSNDKEGILKVYNYIDKIRK